MLSGPSAWNRGRGGASFSPHGARHPIDPFPRSLVEIRHASPNPDIVIACFHDYMTKATLKHPGPFRKYDLSFLNLPPGGTEEVPAQPELAGAAVDPLDALPTPARTRTRVSNDALPLTKRSSSHCNAPCSKRSTIVDPPMSNLVSRDPR